MAGPMASSGPQALPPYPDRFHAAARFWKAEPPGAKPLSQENQLLLYALNQQATVGPNTTTKPWGWNVVESTKWQGWKELGKMSAMEAMRLFVKTLDEEQADWWSLLQQAEAAAAASVGDTPAAAAPQQKSLAERAVLGLWTQPPMGGAKKPAPRYEQGAAILGDAMHVVGGNYGGRYLSDVWSLSLTTCTWTLLTLKAPDAPAAGEDGAAAAAPAAPVLAPTAGHSVTPWNGKLYVVGGHVKGKDAGTMAVRVIDPEARTCANLPLQGNAPVARGGHTASLVGSKLWVFGGEDAGRKALGDVAVLDLETGTWSQPELQGDAPTPRAAASAMVHQDRYIVIFGGGSVATCFNDLYMLDTEELRWSKPAQQGTAVSPRAGHTGTVIGDIWYVIGGGNNVKGCTDLLAADLSALAAERKVTWHVVTSIALRDPLSSEGISLVALPEQRVMVAFGGYNGKYQNAVSLFKAPEGSAAVLAGDGAAEPRAVAAVAATAPAAPSANGSAQSAAAEAKPAAPAAAAPAEVAKPPASAASGPSGSSASNDAAVAELRLTVVELKAQLEGARKEAESAIREAASAKEGAAHELAVIRKQLNTAQQSLADANKTVDESRAALSAEQSKVLKLEATISELQAMLGNMAELEKELDKYRRQAKEAEAKKASAGIWGYIAGGSSS